VQVLKPLYGLDSSRLKSISEVYICDLSAIEQSNKRKSNLNRYIDFNFRGIDLIKLSIALNNSFIKANQIRG
jgi:hypothetical protein